MQFENEIQGIPWPCGKGQLREVVNTLSDDELAAWHKLTRNSAMAKYCDQRLKEDSSRESFLRLLIETLDNNERLLTALKDCKANLPPEERSFRL